MAYDKQSAENIGKRIKRVRDSLKMSQQDLADSLGVHAKTLRSYEKGTGDIKASFLLALHKAMPVSIDYLLGLQSVHKVSSDSAKEIAKQHLALFQELSNGAGAVSKGLIRESLLRIDSGKIENMEDSRLIRATAQFIGKVPAMIGMQRDALGLGTGAAEALSREDLEGLIKEIQSLFFEFVSDNDMSAARTRLFETLRRYLPAGE